MKLKIEDFNLSNDAIYIDTPQKLTVAQAGKIVLDKLQNANMSEYVQKQVMKNPYLWVDILKPNGLQRLNELSRTGDDFLILRLLDD